ncbi:proliferating cell nuclear antigen [Exidia glandulosa HHB12029]|uniref:DNA sliding clamp PCNA n=1 Tax=Exidia glandulosa HHB12029 TaxID=1314781 RepID=A0A165QAG9_EXIGL|nr:proliferating cell nuclear antigen [Exidia glandulosa HHB12029]
MLEAKLEAASTLKKLLDAIKELVTDANFECNEEGLKLQAMDNSHVALVSVILEQSGFQHFRCDRPMPLGVNLASFTKVLKCAKDDDQVTLKAADSADVLEMRFESPREARVSEYQMKLMDIDMDELGIPETDYDACVTMSSSEFQRIVRDLSNLGESVRIEVNKDGVRFAADGEAANGSVLLKQTDSAQKAFANKKKPEAKKKANGKEKVKKEEGDDEEAMDEDKEEDDGGEFKAEKEEEDDDKEEDEEEEDEEEEVGKKRKKSSSSKPSKKAKKGDDGDAQNGVSIEMTQAVTLTFSLKYLVTFSKSAALSSTVELRMSNEVPLLVAYGFGQGHIHYYLAPKIGDE